MKIQKLVSVSKTGVGYNVSKNVK